MKPPIIVDQGGDLLLFKTVEDAESYIEPPEILERSVKAYDGEGRSINLEAPGATKANVLGITIYTSGKIQLVAAEREPTHQDELKTVLIETLRRLGLGRELIAGLSLQDLIETAAQRLGYSRC